MMRMVQRFCMLTKHPVRKAALTGQPVRNKLVGVKLPLGGDLIWMIINAEPLLKPDGTIQYILGYLL